MIKPENIGVVEWLRTAEVTEFIQANHNRFTNKQLADALGLRITNVRSRAYELGLYRMRLEYWTEAQVADLRALYTTMSDTEIVALFQERYPKLKPWTEKHIAKKRGYLNLVRSPDVLAGFHARKLGKEVVAREYAFKSPAAVGDQRIFHNKSGRKCLYEKQPDGAWRPASRLIWQRLHGPIPEGHKVYYKDGDASNCDPANLGLIKTSDVGKELHSGSRALSNRYVAAMLVGTRSGLPKEMKLALQTEYLQQPHLLEAQRNVLRLKRIIKSASQA